MVLVVLDPIAVAPIVVVPPLVVMTVVQVRIVAVRALAERNRSSDAWRTWNANSMTRCVSCAN